MSRDFISSPPRQSVPSNGERADEAVAILSELTVEFATALPQKIDELSDACRELAHDVRAAERAHRVAHGLAGAGTTFGMPEVTTFAREIAVLLRDILEHGTGRTGLLAPTIQRLITDLRRVATRPLSLVPAPERKSARPSLRGNRLATAYMVGVLETEPSHAHGIAAQLVHFGYEVRVIPATEQVSDAHLRGLSAVVCELSMADKIRRIAPTLPLLGMLDRDDLALRLQAVRAGFSALVARPCDAGELARALERLNPLEMAPSERVLIVEDDSRLARSYALTLENAGMVTSILADPMLLLDAVVEFRPEMILMDLYLPDCTGLELAAVLRQDDRVVGVPIVFLTAETRPTSALAALEVGADDFLSKPVAPERLISVVRSRIDRARIVRSFMDRDSLTGLLNHSRTLERVEQEVSLACRRGSPFSLVLIDLDHFKHVNDVHGHVVGDRVLKSLSALLRQRLRRSDIIGRCGGEEFALLLPDTPGKDAVRVIDELRQRFSELSHATNLADLFVTFSAGVASTEEFGTSQLLWEAADAALYAAKDAGRNRAVLSNAQIVERRGPSLEPPLAAPVKEGATPRSAP